jgi:hypothetical protein
MPDQHLAPAPELAWDEHEGLTDTQVLQKVADRLTHLLTQGGVRHGVPHGE